MKSKELRAYIEDRFNKELELLDLGFVLSNRVKSLICYLKEVDQRRTHSLTLITGSMAGATIEINLHAQFHEISTVMVNLLLLPGMTAKQLEANIWNYTRAFTFMLQMSLPNPPFTNSIYPKTTEEADNAIEHCLSTLVKYGLPKLEQYSTISSLIYALEHKHERFNRYLLINDFAIPVIYALGRRYDKALAFVGREEYLTERKQNDRFPIVSYFQFGNNVRKWIEHGAPADFARDILY